MLACYKKAGSSVLWEPVQHSYTEADLLSNAIGDHPCVADHVRCTGYSDRAHARIASDVDLLRDFDGVIDLDAEIANGALDLRVSERLGFILRVSYLIGNQGSAGRRSVLAAARRSSSRRRTPDQPP